MNSIERNVGHAVTRYNELYDQFSEFREKCKSACKTPLKIRDFTRVELASISLRARSEGNTRVIFEGLDNNIEMSFSMKFYEKNTHRPLGVLMFSRILSDDEREKLLTVYFNQHGSIFFDSAANSSDFGFADNDAVETMLLYVLKAYWAIPDNF